MATNTQRDEKLNSRATASNAKPSTAGDSLAIHEYDFPCYSDADTFLREIQHVVPGGLLGCIDKTSFTLSIAITQSEKISIDRLYSSPSLTLPLPSSGRTKNGYFFVLRSNELWVRVPDSYADLAFNLLSVDALPSSLDAVNLQFMGCHHSAGFCYTSYTVVKLKVVL